MNYGCFSFATSECIISFSCSGIADFALTASLIAVIPAPPRPIGIKRGKYVSKSMAVSKYASAKIVPNVKANTMKGIVFDVFDAMTESKNSF